MAAIDAQRSIYYAAKHLSGCVVEVFGDSKIVGNTASSDFHVAWVSTTRRLRLLDLRRNGAMMAGTMAAVCGDSRRDLSQQWSRYFYETSLYKNCDGLIYLNAHNGEIAYALYERASGDLSFDPKDVYRIDDPRLEDSLLQIVQRHAMVLKA